MSGTEEQQTDTSGVGNHPLQENVSESKNVARLLGDVQLLKTQLDEKAKELNNKLEQKAKELKKDSGTMLYFVFGTFFIALVLIGLDYFHNNYERDAVIRKDISEIKNDIYSKGVTEQVFLKKEDFWNSEEIKRLKIENSKNTNILECLKLKQRYSQECFY